MKNIIYKSLAVIAFCGTLTACSDYFDTKSPSSLEDHVLFGSKDYIDGTIANVYVSMGMQNTRARIIWYGYNTDCEYFNNSDKEDGKANLATYAALSNNDQLNTNSDDNLFGNLYVTIERANLVISGINQYADLTDPDIKHLLGEALTLRAMTYMDLVNMWGDVPARFEPAGNNNMYIERAEKDSIYKQLIEDLQLASEYCYWPTESDFTKTTERVNKAFAKGLLARVCLQAAGYSIHPDGEYRLSNDPELSKDVLYPIALQACKDVIAMDGRYVALKTTFQSFWEDICKDVVTAGSESLFEVPYADEPTARGRILYTFGLLHKTSDAIIGLTKGGDVGPMPNLFFDYDKNDTRRDVTCCNFQWNKGVKEPLAVNHWMFGKLRPEWLERFVKAGVNDDGINKLVMRYADVVLMAAEAENYINGPSELCKTYVKKITNRAYSASARAAVATEIDNISSPDAMLNRIMDERKFEFAGEFLRKADLIRWGNIQEKLDETKAKLDDLRNLTGDYADLCGHLYYKNVDFTYTREGVTNRLAGADIQFYGLERGDTEGGQGTGFKEYVSSSGTETQWIKESQIKDEFINSVYVGDPIKHMYWPLMNVNLNDNPKLENYSWY